MAYSSRTLRMRFAACYELQKVFGCARTRHAVPARGEELPFLRSTGGHREARRKADDLVRGSRGPKLSYRSFCSDYKAYLRSVAKLSEIEFSTLHSGHGRGVGRGEFEELVARLRFS